MGGIEDMGVGMEAIFSFLQVVSSLVSGFLTTTSSAVCFISRPETTVPSFRVTATGE